MPATLPLPSQDPRYNDEVDRITGYRTDSLLCMPVRNYYGEIIAVAQVVNKCPDEGDGNFSCFTAKDERVSQGWGWGLGRGCKERQGRKWNISNE